MTNSASCPFTSHDLDGSRLFFIAGPCVIESEKLCLSVAAKLAELAHTYGVTIIFKASYDKANRTAAGSFRGPGIEHGLAILEKVALETELPVCTDIHRAEDAPAIAAVADIIQIPAFLCRQTDLLAAAGDTGVYVNIKKGQFMAPQDMRFAVEKAGAKSLLTERGTFFGYNRLVVDFAGIHTLKKVGVPVIFDATHSVQAPGAGQGCSSGDRSLVVPLACAAVCQKINGLFFEVHPEPEKALCDGANSLRLADFAQQLPRFLELHEKMKSV